MYPSLHKPFDYSTALGAPDEHLIAPPGKEMPYNPNSGYVEPSRGLKKMALRRDLRAAEAKLKGLNVNGISHLLANPAALPIEQIVMLRKDYNHTIPLGQTVLGTRPAAMLTLDEVACLRDVYGIDVGIGGVFQPDAEQAGGREGLREAAFVLGHLLKRERARMDAEDFAFAPRPMATARFRHFEAEALALGGDGRLEDSTLGLLAHDTVRFIRHWAAKGIAGDGTYDDAMHRLVSDFADRLDVLERHGVDILDGLDNHHMPAPRMVETPPAGPETPDYMRYEGVDSNLWTGRYRPAMRWEPVPFMERHDVAGRAQRAAAGVAGVAFTLWGQAASFIR